MKTKNKTIALAEIAIVLCSVFLVAIPAIAADQTTQKVSANEVTTASEDDYVLGIYGNGNEDDTIDMGDVVYTKLAIFGKKPKTELCDAKYDGRINVLDVIQTKLIILGKEKELTVVDANGEDVTVSMPLERIVMLNWRAAEGIRALGAKDRIAGVPEYMTDKYVFFPDLCEKPSVGKQTDPDIEVILTLNPDSIFAYEGTPSKEKLEDKLVGTDIVVIRFNFYTTIREDMDILGYLLGERENALEYLRWYDRCWDEVDEVVSGIAEDDKPDVFLFASRSITETTCTAYGQGSGIHEICERAGGKNIAAELKGWTKVEVEWVIQQDLERSIEVMLGVGVTGGYESDDTSIVEEHYNKIVGLLGFSEITAVRNNRVHLIDHNIAASPVEPVALVYLAKWFYPEQFADLDPEATHQEYVDRFCGIDFDVTKHGVFVYP